MALVYTSKHYTICMSHFIDMPSLKMVDQQ